MLHSMSQAMQQKRCKDCGETLNLLEFPRNHRMKDGHINSCKTCAYAKNKAYRSQAGVKAKYAAKDKERRRDPAYRARRREYMNEWQNNMRSTRKQEWYDKQNGKCAACSDDLDMSAPRETHLDHCHTNGHYRGLLCRGCNIALGHMNEDPTRLRALAEYAQLHC